MTRVLINNARPHSEKNEKMSRVDNVGEESKTDLRFEIGQRQQNFQHNLQSIANLAVNN